MVAKITIPHRIQDALNYNEKKVQQGKAVCIAASGYLLDHEKMNFYQKLAGFENLNSRNERATTKTIHVSLNFDPSEKLSAERLNQVAETYMQKIGFSGQPYLVYRHDDAGHPHVHIVSTTIREDGSRINTHNIGKNISEPARKEIEKLFGLVPAERQQRLAEAGISPVDVEKAIYGKLETKRSISNIVSMVFGKYKFSSLPEFNAVLKQFNVIADRGKEEGRIYKHRGLVYRLLDANGNKIGVPIKASALACRPTLDNLEKKFEANEAAKQPLKASLKNAIDETALQSNSMSVFITGLARKGVYTLLRQIAEGRIYGITFVDNTNRCVFNGSDIGKLYSAAAIQSRITSKQQEPVVAQPKPGLTSKQKNNAAHEKAHTLLEKHSLPQTGMPNNKSIIEELMNPEQQFGNVPYELVKKKKKKKRNLHQ